MIQIHKGKRGKYNNAHTGRFIPLHPEKCSTPKELIFKSSLELRCMQYLDKNPMIVKWQYEPKCIKYFDKIHQKIRRYFFDFVAIAKTGMGTKTLWIEVKPLCETVQPKNKNDVKGNVTWVVNNCKWASARLEAQKNNANFVILTEKELN